MWDVEWGRNRNKGSVIGRKNIEFLRMRIRYFKSLFYRKTSSMVENLNGRVKAYLLNRKECNQHYLNLLRFYSNHTPFLRGARESRVGKRSAEILTGKKHAHLLEMLGYSQFKRKAT